MPERNSPISDVFGRCGFFLIYDQENISEKILRNPFALELGAGVQSARLLIENNVDAVITVQIGCNPFRLLTSANVKVYRCRHGTAGEAIRLFNEGKLIRIENVRDNVSFERKGRRWGRKF
jgi:predicted Fe-Mo cluster-binding NifX family protein